MRVRKQDANGDYSFGNQQNDFYIDTKEGVAQIVKTRLGLFVGEWFLDTTDGTPWMKIVLGKTTQAARDAAIKARILGTENVSEISNYSSVYDGDTRALTVTVTIVTTYGATTLSTTL